MLEQLTKELSQPSDFTTGHTCCNVFGLSGAQGYRLSFPARSRSTCEVASRCALTIHQTASPIDISISKECHAPSSVSRFPAHGLTCHRDISRLSWHQLSECYDQPCVDSKYSLQNIHPDGCSLITSRPLRVDDTQ